MSDPLDKVIPGEPLVIRAATWNAFIDAARLAKGGRREGAGPNEREPLVPCVEVYVKNTTGGSLLNWSVVTPSGYVFDPEALPIPARRHPTFEVAAPASVVDPVFVTVEPIADGKIGRAVAAGVAVCVVEITDAAHRYAVPVAGSLFKMTSAECGPARLLVPGTVGESKQLVLLGAPPCDANETVAGACSTGCGSLVGLAETACLSLEVVCKTGEFDTADFADDFDGTPLSLAKFRNTAAGTWTLQYWDATTSAWVGWSFDYGAGAGVPVLTFGTDGSPILTIDSKQLNLRCLDRDATFAGGKRNGFTGSGTTPTADCAPNDFTLRVACACCDIDGWQGGDKWYCIENTGPTDCVAVFLVEADRCDTSIVICSGPYDTEAEALAACPPPVLIETTCCPSNPIPETLTVVITGGTCPGTYPATWGAALGPLGTGAWEANACTLPTVPVQLYCDSGTWKWSDGGSAPTAYDCTVPSWSFSVTGGTLGTYTVSITV